MSEPYWELEEGSLLIKDDHGMIVTLRNRDTIKLRNFLNARERELRPNKNWDMCSYWNHYDDCECNNEGGDR